MASASKLILTRIIRPLKSRKVRVALATVAAAYLADAGLAVNDTVILAVVTTGVSIVLGIAIEDHGVKSAKANTAEGGRATPDVTAEGGHATPKNTAGGGHATGNGKIL